MVTTTYIDGDVMMYRSAFSGEIQSWGLQEKDGNVYVSCNSRERAQELQDTSQYLRDTTIVRTQEALPVRIAQRNLQNDIRNIQNRTKCDNTVIYLSHPEKHKNDRYTIAKTAPYKGNRKTLLPIHKEAMFDFLCEMGAIVVEGIEADDALGTSLFNDKNGICASIDKDLLMVPGKHYNITSQIITIASDPGALALEKTKSGKKLRGTGFKWFCAQMLMGDPVDNIKGLLGYGDVKAYKTLDSSTHIEDLYRVTKNHFIMSGEGVGRFYENANLLWIRRNENETFVNWVDTHMPHVTSGVYID
jgi:hypothetical protein